MAGTVGLWVNYATQQIFEIDEHEQYIRKGNNAKKIGVPDFVVAEFNEFEPVKDRDKFLLFVIDKSPLIRVREHGNYATFEFSARKADKVFEAITKVGNYLGFGAYTGLYIVNHADNTSASLTWQDFKKASQWADKVSELSESTEVFVAKKLFPTIFDRVKTAKVMTEAQKTEAGLLSIVESLKSEGDEPDYRDLFFDIANHAVIFDIDHQPICYILNYEKWNNGVCTYAYDPRSSKAARRAALRWLMQDREKVGKKCVYDRDVLKSHSYYQDVVLKRRKSHE